MAIKIAYNAGHIRATPGKRIPAKLDPNETREWTLNDRIARYFESWMGIYEGVELLRLDDPNGIEPIDIDQRVAMANNWGASHYLSFHHNAAGVIFNGGGIIVCIDQPGGESEALAAAIYNELIAATGLKGNRADWLTTGDEQSLYECRWTNMPAVLIEYGFMDSTVDAPIILSEDFAFKAAKATAQAVAKHLDLKQRGGFLDVPENAWYAEAVSWAMEAGVATGLDLYHFGPDKPCTRAQAVTMLWRLHGEPEVQQTQMFVDVPDNAWYAKAVRWAACEGITGGVGQGRFDPDAPCTRGQIVTMLYRAAGSPELEIVEDGFTDTSTEDYFAPAVLWATALGITNGTSEDRFGPNEPCTRAQMVAFLKRWSDSEMV